MSMTKSLKDKTFIWSESIADKKGRTHGIYFSNLKNRARCTSLKYGWIIAVYNDSAGWQRCKFSGNKAVTFKCLEPAHIFMILHTPKSKRS